MLGSRRVGIRAFPVMPPIPPGIELRFTEPWEDVCGVGALQFTETWET